MSRDSLGCYLDEIGRYPLLTAFQEIELSRQIRLMLDLQARENKHYTKREQRSIKIGMKAKEKLMRHNLRLVVHIARRFCVQNRHESMDMADFIQEGALGLARACEMYDGTKGYKFSTYAYWWIKQALRRAVDNKSRTIRLPVHATEKIYAIRRFSESYHIENGKYPTVSQIAKHIEMTEEWVKLLMQRWCTTSSLDAAMGKNGDLSITDIIPDPNTVDMDERYAEMELDELSVHLSAGMQALPERERQIVMMRYGIGNDGKQATLDQIGKKLGFCRERSRQLLKRATTKLQVTTRKLAHNPAPKPSESIRAA
ncbi:MAG: sigma-70 family RNA polymerase sigma factor [Cyanobacteriota bacterium]|nr:sigma-70 family RNA polymerase sigma factor [Cyanobacteriota bacterium]